MVALNTLMNKNFFSKTQHDDRRTFELFTQNYVILFQSDLISQYQRNKRIRMTYFSSSHDLQEICES